MTELVSNVSGVLGDIAVAAEEFAEDSLATNREQVATDETRLDDFEEPSDPSTPSTKTVSSTGGFALGALLASLSINLFLPFINGLMLGFGEIIAHEIGFHYNWVGARVS
ncbi:CYFA0S36e00760g1_1 [Cyberlindnera fabianii]|uniref:CYFA0S36e00760g1_1 n=1 Tax=Cyberlindnera fabianii TaxID=36022 RepID=A0A061BEC3_CYBFA|nr:Mitochondrial import protein 1 [Cyberlindnera fabianii]CDR47716.1 CYFA0S36e00760g1_1 [Cyberlindnera fabianii]